MTAAERLTALDSRDGADLCRHAATSLSALVEILSQETTLLRAGRLKQAAELTARKAQIAQDYVVVARAVQREADRLKQTVPNELAALKQQHETLAMQMAENLRVLATAREVTETILTDVARSVGTAQGPQTYGAKGHVAVPTSATGLRGLSVNRAL